MSTEVSRYKWDNMVVVLRDGTDDSIWDGRVKNLVYDTGTMSWIASTGGSGTGAEVEVTNFPASYPVTGTFWQATQPVSIAAPVAVTGTFWQATQPVSIAGTVTVTGTTTTKSALTGSAPTAATVGVTSATAVASNANRKGLILTNTSANTMSFGLSGNAAVLYSGITLPPNGVWVMDEYTFNTGAITAIASAASSNLAIQEMT